MIHTIARRAVLGLGALAVTASLTVAAAQGGTADVYVVHGIDGADLSLPTELPVDISVSGVGCALMGFEFGEVAGPLQLPAGTYDIDISLANPGAPCTNAPVLSATVSFAAGENATVIAHLDASGGLTASKFTNDVSRSALGARAQFHHTAAAPAVDIVVAGGAGPELVLPGVQNGQQGGANFVPGTYRLAVGLAGTDMRVLGPAGGRLTENTLYSVYVVGSAAGGTLTAIVARQSI